MHLIIADHTLKNYQGHSFEYCNSVRNIAINKGWEVTTLGSCQINQELKNKLKAVAFFEYDFFHHFSLPSIINLLPSKFSNFLKSRWNFYQHNKTLFNNLCKLLTNLKTNEPTLILFPTFSFNDIIGITRFAEKLKTTSNIHLAMVQHFTSRPNLESDRFPHRLYKKSFDCLARSPALNNIHLFTDSQDLNDEYKFYIDKPFKVLPIPHTLHSYLKPQNEIKKNKLVIGYLGDARTNKGFHLIPEAISQVESTIGKNTVTWELQTNTPNQNELKTIQAVQLLKDQSRIKLYHHPMDSETYNQVIGNIDIFLLPYTLENYHSQTSGVFSEIRAQGKVAIVSRGTWMAREITNFGGGVLASPEDSKSLADAILQSVHNYPKLKNEAESAAENWCKYHNPESYFSKLITDLPFHIAGS